MRHRAVAGLLLLLAACSGGDPGPSPSQPTATLSADQQELADSIVFVLEGAVSFAGTPAELLAQTGEATIERAFAALMTVRPVEERV